MPLLQTSMSGISVGDDAVNLYYFLKAKSTVWSSRLEAYWLGILTSAEASAANNLAVPVGNLENQRRR